MSHVRRKPQRYPARTIRKKKEKTRWTAIMILLLIFMGVIIGIVFVVLTSP